MGRWDSATGSDHQRLSVCTGDGCGWYHRVREGSTDPASFITLWAPNGVAGERPRGPELWYLLRTASVASRRWADDRFNAGGWWFE